MGSSSRIRSSQNWLPGLGRNLFMVCQQKHACGYQLVKGGPHDKYWTLWEVSDNQNHYPKEAESKINHVLHPFPVTTLSREVLTFSLVCWNSFFPCDHTDLKTNKQTNKNTYLWFAEAEGAFLCSFLWLSREGGLKKHGAMIHSLRPQVRWQVAIWKATPRAALAKQPDLHSCFLSP